MAISETLNLIINAVHKGVGIERVEKGLESVSKAAKSLWKGFKEGAIPVKSLDELFVNIGSSIGSFALNAVQQIPAITKELVNLGIQSEAATMRFERFAGSGETAAVMLQAVQDASLGSIDRMSAMTAASKMLQMGLVGNSDEMETMAAIAIRLGDQTMEAGDRMNDFSLLLSNRSIPRLDNFGISSGTVRERVEELKKEGYGLDEAFKLAVLEEGTKSLQRLGDTSETAAVQVGQLKAAWLDSKTAVGEWVVAFGSATGIIGEAGGPLRQFATSVQESTAQLNNWKASGYSFQALWQGIVTGTIPDGTIATQSLTAAQEAARWATTQHTAAIREEERGISSVSYASESRIGYLNNQVVSQDTLMQRVLDTAAALEEEAKATEEASRAAAEMNLYLNQAAMTFTDYYRRVADEAEEYTQSREDLEQDHQEKLAELAKKGQSWRQQVDEQGLQLEVRIAQGRLDQLLAKQAEFNADTTDLERAQTERSIRQLETQIAEKTGILARAQDGYVTMAGQNTDALLAEENARYQEELALLEENRRAQEEEQRQSLGRMVLQHFQSWAQMQGLTAEEMLAMTLNIQQQYGLIDETAAQHVLAMSNSWAAQLRIMRGETQGFVTEVNTLINSIPTERTVTVHYQATGSTSGLPGSEAQYETGGSTRYQLGTGFAMGGTALVGESGPELVQLPRGARVFSAGQTRRAGGMGSTVINIGPVRIVGEDPAVIWRQLERYARLKGKSGWSQLGR